ncbi:hypothetical protein AGMMS49983_04590 [Clostridia bacterium]|nr:hypothetical protein AGMMS49983_04590 [Clostridia bacterium]
MPELSQKIFHANSDFEFSSVACDCEVDVTHPSKGVTKYTFRLYPKSDIIYYAYIAGRGLVSKNKDGAFDGRAVLPDLLAIKDGDAKAVEAFIEQHGFFLPLDANEDNAIDAESLFCLIDRLKAMVALMSALGEPKTRYKQILALTLYLLLSPTVTIQLPNFESPFLTCIHDVWQVWNGVYPINENILRSEDVGYNVDEGYRVVDSVRPPETWLTTNEYSDAVGYESIDLSGVKASATYLFRNAVTAQPPCRLAVDFLYHFCKEVGDIKAWNHKGDLTFVSAPPTAAQFRDTFDEQLQSALITLAKNTLKTEIEYNLNGVVPSYDTETMAPSWRVEYLLAGLYFSVFYMRPKIELYRICANPNCRLPFLVKTTSSKQKYCQPACANAMAQRNHRRKMKALQATNEPDPIS